MSSFSATMTKKPNKEQRHFAYQTAHYNTWTFMAFDYHKNGYNQLLHFQQKNLKFLKIYSKVLRIL